MLQARNAGVPVTDFEVEIVLAVVRNIARRLHWDLLQIGAAQRLPGEQQEARDQQGCANKLANTRNRILRGHWSSSFGGWGSQRNRDRCVGCITTCSAAVLSNPVAKSFSCTRALTGSN